MFGSDATSGELVFAHTEVADLIGSYVQTPSGNFEWVDGDLVKCAENGEVYFIDEIGLIDIAYWIGKWNCPSNHTLFHILFLRKPHEDHRLGLSRTWRRGA